MEVFGTGGMSHLISKIKTALGGKIDSTEKGANNGVATLDSSGKVPSSQLPSYVDDVLEYANLASFPSTGESGKIYVDQATGKVYRWASSDYAIISDYTHPSYTARTGKPTENQTPAFGATFTVSQITSDSSGHVTGATDRTITIPSATATTSVNGLMSSTDKSKLDGVASGAEVNQNAFSNVKVGSTTIAADAKTDTLELVAGSNVTLTPDATNDKVTIAATDPTAIIDDLSGDGDDDLTWSADKLTDECFCLETGTISSFPKTITDARITQECWIEDFVPDENVDIGWVTQDGKLILYGTLPSGTTLASKKLTIHRVHGLTNDAVTLTLRQQNSTSANGHYLVAEVKNLTPGVQYTWYLYSVANNTETQVSAIGQTTSSPSASRWYQQVTYSLASGNYVAKINPTTDATARVTSNTVAFTAATLSS